MDNYCISCDTECVGAVFCGMGGQDTPDVRLPKTLTVSIEANPSYWGFGGILFSGDVEYGTAQFDYWDNFDEDHLADKPVGDSFIKNLDNYDRPDNDWRSVYDPDSGTTTYDGASEYGSSLGGPSVYLIDRSNGDVATSIGGVEFGFGNKILFNDNIYKNLTGAWRGVDTDNPSFTANTGGLPDGSVAGEYSGSIKTSGIYRDTSVDPFIHLDLQYNSSEASAVKNGNVLYLKNSDSTLVSDGPYYITKVQHNGTHTTCSLVGSVGNQDFTHVGSGTTWIIENSYDEQTCEGLVAYGVDYTDKCRLNQPNYHADLGVVINDSRNRIHSNRKERSRWGYPAGTRSRDDSPRRDYTYVSVQENGHGFLVKEEETDNIVLSCSGGIWDPTWDFIYTSGDSYLSSFTPESLTGLASGLINDCGCNSGEALGLCDIGAGCLPAGWSKYVVASGMSPLYSKELPFYGPFYDVYSEDEAVRAWQNDNTIKGRNLTCYTKKATLEVFPDCITQKVEYTQCGGGETELVTNVPRMAFVYRCFDYPDPCEYDESGRPYNGAPSNIDDLRRGLAGQEVYMYLNFGTAWAGEINRDPCGCVDPPPGTLAPNMMEIESPVTFPCFLNWDADPNAWGAQDQLWKKYAASVVGDSIANSSCPLPITGDYSYPHQPYTTYGFIRNVCGKETNSNKSVIESLNSVNTGNYRETTPDDNTIEPMYWEFPVHSGLPWGSGLTSFVNDSGTLATWGVVDNNNRLIAPYYPVESGNQYAYCNPESIVASYAKFNSIAAFKGEWPTDQVPFLIRIEHDNNCVGCGTTNMSTDNTLQISLESLDTSYNHNKVSSYKYGYSNCGYNGEITSELGWSCESGFSDPSECYENAIYTPHIGESCECVGGNTYTLYPEMLQGTNIPKYWATRNDNNPENAFVQIDGCDVPRHLYRSDPPYTHGESGILHAAITLSCNNAAFYNSFSSLYDDYDYYGGNPLAAIYGCGGCSHSYPGVNNRPNLNINWMMVSDINIAHFQNLDTASIFAADTMGWLCEGPTAGVQAAYDGGYFCSGSAPLNTGGACDGYRSSDFINWHLGCVGDESGVIFGTTDLPACDGSIINFYGCLLMDEPAPNAPCSCNYFSRHFEDCQAGNCCVYNSGSCDHQPDSDLNFLSTGCYINERCDGVVDYEINGDAVSQLPEAAHCGCNCINQYDLLASMTYHDSYDFGGGVILSGVWVVDTHNCKGSITVGNGLLPGYPDCGSTAPTITAISGGNIPGLGNFGPVPNVGSIACSLGATTPTPYCSWKTDIDPNAFAENLEYKIIAPGQADQVDFPGDIGNEPCAGLFPKYCDTQWVSCTGSDMNVYRGTCYTPIYQGPVNARRKRSYPEIMTVHKIDCLGAGSGYNLHVSREYHNHGRAWTYPIDGYTCDFYQGAVDGGGYNWRRSYIGPGEGPCPEFYHHPCSGSNLSEFAQVWPAVDTGDSNYNLEGPLPSYYLLPHSIPADQVTPAYPTINDSADPTSQSLCSYHPHSGTLPNHSVTRDFQYTIKPFQSKWREWIPKFDENGAYQLPTYTGGFDPVDTGVPGDYCDVSSNTGEMVNIWIQRNKVSLPPNIEASLQDSSTTTIYSEFVGGASCSGVSWAIEVGSGLKEYDYGNYKRYFILETAGESACDINQKYPNLSGVTLWNYYNLFYGSGNPTSDYYNYVDIIQPDEEGDCNDPGRHDAPWNFVGQSPSNIDNDHFGPLYSDIDDIPLNRKHSCIQDMTMCGGDLWNNKMFFPRKSYEVNTRVTEFGALSTCTQDGTLENSSWLEGYEDLGDPDILVEARNTKFIDACDLDAHSVTLQSACDIDDVIIHVDDYLPLVGLYNIDRKLKLGDYTCLQPDSGCYDLLPIHSDSTLNQMTFVPAKTFDSNNEVSFGYYLDKLVTDAQDQCLFKPFKIMVDVDCCPDVIRKIGQEGSGYDPTFMQWIDYNVPDLACRAWGNTPSCECSNTECGNTESREFKYANTCVRHYELYPYIEYSGIFCSGSSCEDSGFWYKSGAGVDCNDDYVFKTSYGYLDTPIQILVSEGGPYPESTGSGEVFTNPSCNTCQISFSGSESRCISETSSSIALFNICDIVGQVSSSGTYGGYKCGDYTYLDPNATEGCCTYDNNSICELLSESYKISNGECLILDGGVSADDYTADASGCPCFQYTNSSPYESNGLPCGSTQNILITISET